MAIKVLGILPNKYNTQPQPQTSNQQTDNNEQLEQTSVPRQFLQGGLDLGASLLGLPGQFQQYTQSFFPDQAKELVNSNSFLEGRLPTGEELRSKVRPENYTEPKTALQKAAYSAGSFAPGVAASLLTGGAAAPLLVRAAAGVGGETLAHQAGLGPVGEIFLGLLGSYGAGKALSKGAAALSERGLDLSKWGIKPNDLTTTAKAAQEYSYNLEKQLGRDKIVPGKHFSQNLEEYYDKINSNSGISSAVKEELKAKALEVKSIVKEGKLIASDLVEKKKQINQLYKDSLFTGKKGEEPRKFLDQLQSLIFKEGDAIGKEGNNVWRKAWRNGDDITKALKYGESLKDIADETPGFTSSIKKIMNNPLSKLLGYSVGLGTGAATGYLPLAAGATAIGVGAQGASALYNKGKYLYKFLEAPSTRHLLKKAAEQTLHQQAPQLLKTYSQLNKMSDNYIKEYPEVIKEIESLEKPAKTNKFKVLGVIG